MSKENIREKYVLISCDDNQCFTVDSNRKSLLNLNFGQMSQLCLDKNNDSLDIDKINKNNFECYFKDNIDTFLLTVKENAKNIQNAY